MRFRTGLIAGLAVGYYFGARAGRERYEQIQRFLQPIRESDAFRAACEAARDMIDAGLRATREALRDATAPDVTVVDFRRAS